MATTRAVQTAELYRTIMGEPISAIVMNPIDVTDEVRKEIEEYGPGIELMESTMVASGQGYILNLAQIDAEMGLLFDA